MLLSEIFAITVTIAQHFLLKETSISSRLYSNGIVTQPESAICASLRLMMPITDLTAAITEHDCSALWCRKYETRTFIPAIVLQEIDFYRIDRHF